MVIRNKSIIAKALFLFLVVFVFANIFIYKRINGIGQAATFVGDVYTIPRTPVYNEPFDCIITVSQEDPNIACGLLKANDPDNWQPGDICPKIAERGLGYYSTQNNQRKYHCIASPDRNVPGPGDYKIVARQFGCDGACGENVKINRISIIGTANPTTVPTEVPTPIPSVALTQTPTITTQPTPITYITPTEIPLSTIVPTRPDLPSASPTPVGWIVPTHLAKILPNIRPVVVSISPTSIAPTPTIAMGNIQLGQHPTETPPSNSGQEETKTVKASKGYDTPNLISNTLSLSKLIASNTYNFGINSFQKGKSFLFLIIDNYMRETSF